MGQQISSASTLGFCLRSILVLDKKPEGCLCAYMDIYPTPATPYTHSLLWPMPIPNSDPQKVVWRAKPKLHMICHLWETEAVLHCLVSIYAGLGAEKQPWKRKDFGISVYLSLLLFIHSLVQFSLQNFSLFLSPSTVPLSSFNAGGWGMGAVGVTWSWARTEPLSATSEAVPALMMFVSKRAI